MLPHAFVVQDISHTCRQGALSTPTDIFLPVSIHEAFTQPVQHAGLGHWLGEGTTAGGGDGACLGGLQTGAPEGLRGGQGNEALHIEGGPHRTHGLPLGGRPQ